MFFNFRLAAMALVVMTVLSSKPAWAYLDPGSGSYLMQIIVAGAITGGTLLTMVWGRLKVRLVKLLKKEQKDNHGEKENKARNRVV